MVSAEKALKAGGGSAETLVTEPRLGHGPLADQLAALSARAAPRMLVSGHPAMLTDLLRHLVPGVPESHTLRPASLAWLRLTGSLPQAGAGRLERLVAADDLPDGFPYPGPDGPERRPRPAYYYRQSAALPYRLYRGALQVLLVTSSSGRKWVIPKGICEPGLTPQASAAQEALEEAGVTGQIEDGCIARYAHAKWGATCCVAVYPLAVTGILSGRQWGERHRRRKWLSPRQAAAQVSHPDLARIIAGFAAP